MASYVRETLPRENSVFSSSRQAWGAQQHPSQPAHPQDARRRILQSNAAGVASRFDNLRNPVVGQPLSCLEGAIGKPLDQIQVLIVDDMPVFRHILRRLIGPIVAEVAVASDGREALELLRTRHTQYDLIITDVHMPVMGGFELLKILRGAGMTLPVLVLTTDRDPELLQRLRTIPRTCIAFKPIDSTAFLALLRSLAASER